MVELIKEKGTKRDTAKFNDLAIEDQQQIVVKKKKKYIPGCLSDSSVSSSLSNYSGNDCFEIKSEDTFGKRKILIEVGVHKSQERPYLDDLKKDLEGDDFSSIEQD